MAQSNIQRVHSRRTVMFFCRNVYQNENKIQFCQYCGRGLHRCYGRYCPSPIYHQYSRSVTPRITLNCCRQPADSTNTTTSQRQRINHFSPVTKVAHDFHVCVSAITLEVAMPTRHKCPLHLLTVIHSTEGSPQNEAPADQVPWSDGQASTRLEGARVSQCKPCIFWQHPGYLLVSLVAHVP